MVKFIYFIYIFPHWKWMFQIGKFSMKQNITDNKTSTNEIFQSHSFSGEKNWPRKYIAKGSIITRSVLKSDKKFHFWSREDKFGFFSEHHKDLSDSLWAILILKEFNLSNLSRANICSTCMYYFSKMDWNTHGLKWAIYFSFSPKWYILRNNVFK